MDWHSELCQGSVVQEHQYCHIPVELKAAQAIYTRPDLLEMVKMPYLQRDAVSVAWRFESSQGFAPCILSNIQSVIVQVIFEHFYNVVDELLVKWGDVCHGLFMH